MGYFQTHTKQSDHHGEPDILQLCSAFSRPGPSLLWLSIQGSDRKVADILLWRNT